MRASRHRALKDDPTLLWWEAHQLVETSAARQPPEDAAAAAEGSLERELVEERVEGHVVPVDIIRRELEQVLVAPVHQVREGHLLPVVWVDPPRHKIKLELVRHTGRHGETLVGRREYLGVHLDGEHRGQIAQIAHEHRRLLVRLDVTIAQIVPTLSDAHA